MQLVSTAVDALIPFCFGATQALVIFSISMRELAWLYFAFPANALVGSSSYMWMVHQLPFYDYRAENRIAFESAKPFVYRARRFAVAQAVIFFSFGVTEALLGLNSLLLAIVAYVNKLIKSDNFA
jgi:hypothetical protein